MRKILKKNIDCAMTYMAYLDEDGLEICLYFPNMSEKTREKFVEAFND